MVAGGAGFTVVAGRYLVSAAAAAAGEQTLDARRAGTLASVLAALSLGPAVGLRAEERTLYGDAFAAHYAAADPHFRSFADATLDDVEAAVPGGYSTLSAGDALAELTRWSTTNGRQPLAACALVLAGMSFEEDDARQVGYALPTI